MLRLGSRHTKSMSCCTVQREVAMAYPLLTARKHSEQTFVPFNSERRLGRLISSQPAAAFGRHSSNQQLLEKINHKNFQKIYQMVMKFENRKYSQQTRTSGQRDLINHEWKVNNLSLPRQHNATSLKSTSKKFNDGHSSQAKPRKFDKMNEYLYKKLSKVEEPSSNSELCALYSNYIAISEMNENIRRSELLGRQKTKMRS